MLAPCCINIFAIADLRLSKAFRRGFSCFINMFPISDWVFSNAIRRGVCLVLTHCGIQITKCVRAKKELSIVCCLSA